MTTEEIEDIQLQQITAAMLINCHAVDFNNISMAIESIVRSLTRVMIENCIPFEVLKIEDAVINSITVGLKLCRKVG